MLFRSPRQSTTELSISGSRVSCTRKDKPLESGAYFLLNPCPEARTRHRNSAQRLTQAQILRLQTWTIFCPALLSTFSRSLPCSSLISTLIYTNAHKKREIFFFVHFVLEKTLRDEMVCELESQSQQKTRAAWCRGKWHEAKGEKEFALVQLFSLFTLHGKLNLI